MPSRLGVGLILLFWLGTAAVVGYRDVWPRLFSDGPPPLRIDLADEAAQAVPARWTVYRGEQPVGTLVTKMVYVPEDDTFRFVNSYRNLKFDFGQLVGIEVPQLETVVRVSRAGDLREQHMTGELVATLGRVEVGKATAEVTGVVRDGQLVGRCKIRSPVMTVDQPLEPVPVPAGQVMNPMMPVGRLRDVQPGRRWVIREVDPLREAMDVLLREVAKKSGQDSKLLGALPGGDRDRELLAEVKGTPEKLTRKDGTEVECWVIEYRRDEARARTWVSKEDGRVLRQEASGFGEQLRFERED
jgi:hypothetical protein